MIMFWILVTMGNPNTLILFMRGCKVKKSKQKLYFIDFAELRERFGKHGTFQQVWKKVEGMQRCQTATKTHGQSRTHTSVSNFKIY